MTQGLCEGSCEEQLAVWEKAEEGAGKCSGRAPRAVLHKHAATRGHTAGIHFGRALENWSAVLSNHVNT